MNKKELMTIRDATADDVSFIYASWLKGLYYGESWFSLVKKQVFMSVYHDVIEHILTNTPVHVKVACDAEDSRVILGYAVYSDAALHWVFVKKAFRAIGIAKALVPAHIKTVTHLTRAGVSILKKKELDFNPFLIGVKS